MTLRILPLFIIALLFAGCVAPDPVVDLSPQNKDVYITNRDVIVNFANYITYAIVDSVVVVSQNPNDTLNNKSQFSNLILSEINFQLQNIGFIKVNRTQNPDVGINTAVLRFSQQIPTAYFAYAVPGSGFYGYPSTSFWGYPAYVYGYPSYYGYYQVDIGSIDIQMIDLKNAPANTATKKLNVIWSAFIAGSLSDSTGVANSRIQEGIRGAFNQSPYLKEGK
jgi:hypothetical protein